MIINGEGLVMGRLAATVAKKLLNGESVAIVNCEKVIITGNKEATYEKYFAHTHRGRTTRGPYFPRRSDLFLKRIIRGMLPNKRTRGRNALRNIRCFIGVPIELEGKEQITIKEAKKEIISNYITIHNLTKLLGAKA